MSKLNKILKEDWEMQEYDAAVLAQQVKDLFKEVVHQALEDWKPGENFDAVLFRKIEEL